MTNDEEEDAAPVEEEDVGTGAGSVPDFHWLTGHLAVGGCFPPERSAALAAEYGIRAVVDLRAESCDDPEALRAAGIDFLHLPTPDLEPASHVHLEAGVEFVRERLDRGEKVLIHCQHGIGRSALLALCVLVDQGFAPLDALVRAKERREAVSPSRSQYEGWAMWLRARGLTPPDYHSYGCIAYRRAAVG
jgi:protein-tyrosine phosphatase